MCEKRENIMNKTYKGELEVQFQDGSIAAKVFEDTNRFLLDGDMTATLSLQRALGNRTENPVISHKMSVSY